MTAAIMLHGLCASSAELESPATDLASTPTRARATDGGYISWREHRIDDEGLSGIALRGGDGLALADLDGDGYLDVVSVHESDEQYDGVADGHIRIAFGSVDPDRWTLVTLAEGAAAGAAEDVAIGDINGDGWPDIVVACELAHLIYFENPRRDIRTGQWPRLIPAVTQGRGSFIRVFLADLNGDGRPEVLAANKGAQDPERAAQEPKAIAFFELTGAPLDDASWREHVLTQVPWPINAQPVDLDGDDDIDIVGGSVAEGRIFWFENRGRDSGFAFVEHRIDIAVPEAAAPRRVNGFNMAFADLSGDGRLDIVSFDTARLIGSNAIWLEQPDMADQPWPLHDIGNYAPDALVGFALADINGDGRLDLMSGGYSLGSRTEEGVAGIGDALGRLAWFEHPALAAAPWVRHDFSRRQRGMFDQFIPFDMDGDGDIDFVSTRGNSGPYDGVFWLEQVRGPAPRPAFTGARAIDSPEMPLP